jgi:hypothetical protein
MLLLACVALVVVFGGQLSVALGQTDEINFEELK